MSRIHIPIGDAYEVQTWDELHDRWLPWSFAADWPEAQAGCDHAIYHCGIDKGKARIVKL